MVTITQITLLFFILLLLSYMTIQGLFINKLARKKASINETIENSPFVLKRSTNM